MGISLPPSRPCRAQFQDALLLLDGRFVKKDPQGAYALMQAAAEAGNRLAQFNFAQLLIHREPGDPAWPRRSPTIGAQPTPALPMRNTRWRRCSPTALAAEARRCRGAAMAARRRAAEFRHRAGRSRYMAGRGPRRKTRPEGRLRLDQAAPPMAATSPHRTASPSSIWADRHRAQFDRRGGLVFPGAAGRSLRSRDGRFPARLTEQEQKQALERANRLR